MGVCWQAGVSGVARTGEEVADGHRHTQRGIARARLSPKEKPRVDLHVRREKHTGDGERPGAAGVV